jgi:hypothetical protein
MNRQTNFIDDLTLEMQDADLAECREFYNDKVHVHVLYRVSTKGLLQPTVGRLDVECFKCLTAHDAIFTDVDDDTQAMLIRRGSDISRWIPRDTWYKWQDAIAASFNSQPPEDRV